MVRASVDSVRVRRRRTAGYLRNQLGEIIREAKTLQRVGRQC
jgi:hypothetical protein